jgi:hypothetical protein
MYERMLDKNSRPSEEDIREYLGGEGSGLLLSFEQELGKRYDYQKELVFPFGNHYGWGYKYSCNSKHLCHLFFEKGAFTILLQISGKDKPRLESILEDCLPKSGELWERRYPCGDGGWMHYRVIDAGELKDIIRFIEIKKKPVRNE